MTSEAWNESGDAEGLSALVDGEVDSATAHAACARFKIDARVRSDWHAYQLIGDVLRSDELARGAGRNEQFLVSLRARLQAEPVVLAPEPLPAPSSLASRGSLRASRWMLPSAMAAGLLLVVGTFSVLGPRNSPVGNAAPVAVADATLPGRGDVPAGSSSVAESVTGPAVVMTGKVIRDARLDRYLAAHKQFSGSSALGLPSAFLRSATVESDGR